MSSRTSSNVGHLDLPFDLLFQVTRVTLVKSITPTMGQAMMVEFGAEILRLELLDKFECGLP